MLAGANQPFDISLHQKLQHRLGDGTKEIATVLLGQKLRKVHVGLGHHSPLCSNEWRINGSFSIWFVVEASKLQPTIHLDGHPALHR
jgi:hypothetical protein